MPERRRRLRAKLVPMESVAGSAGGTTIVIRSSARIRMVCHGIYTFWLYAVITIRNDGTYSELDKLDSACAETKSCDSRKHHDKPN